MQALDDVVRLDGPEVAERLVANVVRRAATLGVAPPVAVDTAYVNTIPVSREPDVPGDEAMEARIEALVRYDALAIVQRANLRSPGIGGHIGSFASAATLFEVGFNHFFRGHDHPDGRDIVFFQGHAAPGVYARAFLEGRLTETQLENFRRELEPGGGLPSYPHPWSMPDFWEYPTVSMGLASLMAIHEARMLGYLQARGFLEKKGRVWALVGDGEMDEPESLAALALAARESLDNLTIIVNCNLQRLDGPVRGNHKIVQELEGRFRGAGWNVVKVLFGRDWDALFEADVDGLLVQRLGEAVDGDFQRWAAGGGKVLREELFGGDLAPLVKDYSDEALDALKYGGHDRRKVYAAFAEAEASTRPTVILAQTVKGFGLDDAGEAQNVAHKTKKLSHEQLVRFRDRFDVPIDDDDLEDTPFLTADEEVAAYLHERRAALGGYVPSRRASRPAEKTAAPECFEPYTKGSERESTTTMVAVRLLSKLVGDDNVGPYVVPIVADEARTFGLEALFPKIGIYSPGGQKYEPVDSDQLLSYDERADGQILEEGISEAGALASFIAAGTAPTSHKIPTIPFYFFYSMFGFQRVGDLIWAAADARARGFLFGATSGRTTLNGEGLQHQDGHSQLVAMAYPNVNAYDPAYAYELATIVQNGMMRMARGEDALFYITVANEPGPQPAMGNVDPDAIIRGMYRRRRADRDVEVQLLSSGTLLREAEAAAELLTEEFDVATEVWSVTSWKALYDDVVQTERHNRRNESSKTPYVAQLLGDDAACVVAVSDWMRAVSAVLGGWIDNLTPLGTDGFGLSETREALRSYFEVDRQHIAAAALAGLARRGHPKGMTMKAAFDALGIEEKTWQTGK